MVQVEFEPEVEAKVRELEQECHTTEGRVLEEVMLRWLEDRQDYERGMKSLMSTGTTYSLGEIRRLSDVAD